MSSRQHVLLARRLPPEVEEEPPGLVMDRFRSYLSETIKGYNFSESLKMRMDFQNPYLLEEVVRQFSIDENASAFPPELFNPQALTESDYIEAISAAQVKAEEERAVGQSSAVRSAVPFVSGGFQLPPQPAQAGFAAMSASGAKPMSAAAQPAAANDPVMSAALAAARQAAAAASASTLGKRPATVGGDSAAAAAAGVAGSEPLSRKSKWDR